MNKKKILCFLFSVLFIISSVSFEPFVHATEPVAKVNGNNYSSLKDAIFAASLNDTITLLSDVTVDTSISIDKTIAISCEGHTISSTTSLPCFNVSSGKLTLRSCDISSSGVAIVVDGGSIQASDIDFINCNGAIRIENGSATIDNCSFENTNVALYSNASSLKISGAFNIGGNDIIELSYGKTISFSNLSGDGHINIKVDGLRNGDIIGSLDDDTVISRFLVYSSSNDFYSVKLSGSSIVVGQTSDIAEYNGKIYSSLESAFAAINGNNNTIKLLNNAVITDEIQVRKNVNLISNGDYSIVRLDSSIFGFLIADGVSFNIANSGGNILFTSSQSSGSTPFFYNSGNLVLGSGCSISSNFNTTTSSKYKGIIYNFVNSSLTVDGANISNNESTYGAIYNDGGSVKINSCTISKNIGSYGSAIYINSGKVELNGGSFTSNSASQKGGSIFVNGSLSILGKVDFSEFSEKNNDIYLTAGRVITISDKLNDSAIKIPFTMETQSEGEKIAISTSNDALNSSLFINCGSSKDSLDAKTKDNYVYLGKKSNIVVAFVEDKPYYSIKEAVNACDSTSNIVEVVSNVTFDETVIVPQGKSIVISTKKFPNSDEEYTSRTFTRQEGFTAAFFSIQDGASVEFKPEQEKRIIFDCSLARAADSAILCSGHLTLNNVIIKNNIATINESLTESTQSFSSGGAIYISQSGEVIMNSGSLEFNYASRGGAVFVNDGKFNLIGGTISNNSALYGGGVMVCNNTTTDNKTLDENGLAPVNTEGIFKMSGATISSNNAIKNDNISSSGIGGAVLVGNAATFEITGGLISSNNAEKGNGVAVGTIRQEGELETRIPVFNIGQDAKIADDVYLSIYNDSYISVISNLNEVNPDNPIKIGLSNLKYQNSLLVNFNVDSTSVEQNEIAAKQAIDTGLFVLTGDFSDRYIVSLSTSNNAQLVNIIDSPYFMRYKPGVYYNGLPEFEDDRVVYDLFNIEEEDDNTETDSSTQSKEQADDTSSDEETPVLPIYYSKLKLDDKSSFSSYFEFSYYYDLYENVSTNFIAQLPKGTILSLVDLSDIEHVSYYRYIVSGNEEVVQSFDKKNADDRLPLNEVLIPIRDFFSLVDGTSYGEYLDSIEKDEEDIIVTERFALVVDLSFILEDDEYFFDGEYTIRLQHLCDNSEETDGFDISQNFGQIEYSINEESQTSVALEKDKDKKDIVHVSYTIEAPSRIIDSNFGIIEVQFQNREFPNGTFVTVDEVDYTCTQKSGSIYIPLPKDGTNRIIKENQIDIKFGNYYGKSIDNESIVVSLLSSNDGYHYQLSPLYEATSEPVKILLEKRDEYAISVVGTNGIKPSYEFKNAKSAETLMMQITALCNSNNINSLKLYVEQYDGKDYEVISLSSLFIGFDEEKEDYSFISTGSYNLKLFSDVNAGTYRLVFSVGDKKEYVKLLIKS